MNKNYKLTYSLIFLGQTRNSIRVRETSISQSFWLPKSQIDVDDYDTLVEGETIDIDIPNWLAVEKELY